MKKANFNIAVLGPLRPVHVMLMGLSLLIMLQAMPASAGVVNINKADSNTLERHLVGVGQKEANLIVLYRRLYGPITGIADLMQIPGITLNIIAENSHNIGFRHGMVTGASYDGRVSSASTAFKSPSLKKQKEDGYQPFQERRYRWVRQVNVTKK